jgi:prepilin-type N-terminal cleavage/methylation domain-containing protein
VPSCRQRAESEESGFSLVETIVALALLAVILLSGLTLLTLQPRLQDRARAGEEALRAIEAALETLRAQELPLEGGQLLPGIAYPVIDPDRDLRVTLEVEPLETPDLFELRLVATYLTWGRPASRTVTTQAWRP